MERLREEKEKRRRGERRRGDEGRVKERNGMGEGRRRVG